MRVIDFHNHFYPPAYLEALRSGSSAVEVSIDDEGNPRIYYPGDYNIAVPGHRDIDYREQVLSEQRRGHAGAYADHAGHARREARDRGALRRAGERRVRGGGRAVAAASPRWRRCR